MERLGGRRVTMPRSYQPVYFVFVPDSGIWRVPADTDPFVYMRRINGKSVLKAASATAAKVPVHEEIK